MINAYNKMNWRCLMNFDKTIVYDERPGFESYSMMNMNYPSMPMIPNMGFNPYNQLESRISSIEKRIQKCSEDFAWEILKVSVNYKK